MSWKDLPAPVCLAKITSEHENGWGNPITRRRFLKRTGGATASAFLAMYLSDKALATTEGGTPAAGESAEPPKNWYLVCYQDPGPTTGNGPYQQESSDYEGEDAHDGGYPLRTFYKRKATTYDGGERALFLEIRTKGPVQCPRNAQGEPTPAVEDLRGSITISDNRIWAGVTMEGNNTQRWLEFLESGQLTNDFTDVPGPTLGFAESAYQVKAHRQFSATSGGTTLSIDKLTGKVTYNPQQVVPEDGNAGYEEGLGMDYRLQAFGVVKPSLLVQGVASAGEEDDIKWSFGGEGASKGAKVVAGMEWTNIAATVNKTAQWQIWKAYRVRNKDGSEGPIQMVGEATPENQVEITTPPSLERK